MAKKTKEKKELQYATINFGGVFLLSRQETNDGEMISHVRFPNSRPVERTVHDPYLTVRYRDLDREIGKVDRNAHEVHAGIDGSAVVSIGLFGEDQMWSESARWVRFLPDGVEIDTDLEIHESIREIYDAADSGVSSLWAPNDTDGNGAKYSAIVPIPGGKISAVRRVPGKWEIHGKELKLRDGLRWLVPFKKFLVVQLVSNVRVGSNIQEIEKRVVLRPQDGPLHLSITSFSTRYSESHGPSYPILERMIPGLPPEPLREHGQGTRYPWPVDTSAASPSSVFCPNFRFGTFPV